MVVFNYIKSAFDVVAKHKMVGTYSKGVNKVMANVSRELAN